MTEKKMQFEAVNNGIIKLKWLERTRLIRVRSKVQVFFHYFEWLDTSSNYDFYSGHVLFVRSHHKNLVFLV